jgi:regulator of replication initiation timing
MWEDELDKSIDQIDKQEQLEVEIGALLDKIQKLKHKKRAMEEVVNSLKLENAKLNGGVKALGFMLLFSWFICVVIVLVLT